jgi:cytochrome c oxidase subunit 2
MRPSLPFSVLVLAFIAVICGAVPDSFAQSNSSSEGVQVITVTAKKYEFNPSPIRVKQGTKVRLTITATDHSHGFKISPFPEGTETSGEPGLVFSSAQDCTKIEKGQTATVEFVAQKAGTYPFRCCSVCGIHHHSMKGELIVEP